MYNYGAKPAHVLFLMHSSSFINTQSPGAAVMPVAFKHYTAHNLTFPQHCREILAFFDFSFKLSDPLPFPCFCKKFDFYPALYVYIVF